MGVANVMKHQWFYEDSRRCNRKRGDTGENWKGAASWSVLLDIRVYCESDQINGDEMGRVCGAHRGE